MHQDKPKIYILCGNAAYNKGDRGNLHAQINLLRSRFPGCEITYDSLRPEVDRYWYDANVVKRGKFLSVAQIKGIINSDVVVWGGGALLADNACRLLVPFWLALIATTKIILRKPIMAWAHGLVIETTLGAVLAKMALELTDVISVRDQGSFNTVKRINVKNTKCFLTADPAILVNAAKSERGKEILESIGISTCEKPIFAISPTFWPFYHDKTDWLPFIYNKHSRTLIKNQPRIDKFKESLSSICDNLIKDYDARILLLPRYPGSPWKDVEYLSEIRELSKNKCKIHIFDRDLYSPFDYLSIYPFFKCLISTALHDCIFATALDVPCVNLYYEEKGKNFFEAIDSVDRMANWAILFERNGVDQVMAIINRTLSNWQSNLKSITNSKNILQNQAKQNAEILATLLEAGPMRN